jgi:hypothetical protein
VRASTPPCRPAALPPSCGLPGRSRGALPCSPCYRTIERRYPLYDCLVITKGLRLAFTTRVLIHCVHWLSMCLMWLSGPKASAWEDGCFGRLSKGMTTIGYRQLRGYGVWAIYKLTCFITAHEEAQEEMSWMYDHEAAGSGTKRMASQVAQVAGESKIAVRRARHYLRDLSKIVVQGQELADVIDGVRARQIASLLIHKISIFIEQMHDHGILDSRSLHRLLHDLEHDQLHLQSRVETLQRKQLLARKRPARKASRKFSLRGGVIGGSRNNRPDSPDMTELSSLPVLHVAPDELRNTANKIMDVQKRHLDALLRRLKMGPPVPKPQLPTMPAAAPPQCSNAAATCKEGVPRDKNTESPRSPPRSKKKASITAMLGWNADAAKAAAAEVEAARPPSSATADSVKPASPWAGLRKQSIEDGSRLNKMIADAVGENGTIPQKKRKASVTAGMIGAGVIQQMSAMSQVR